MKTTCNKCIVKFEYLEKIVGSLVNSPLADGILRTRGDNNTREVHNELCNRAALLICGWNSTL